MNEIKEYKIIRGPKAKVENDVNEEITEGWQPYGSLVISDRASSSYPILFQAMVKYNRD